MQLINAEIDTVILFCLRLIDGGKKSIYGTAPNPKVQPVWKEKISKKGMEYKKINIQKSFILIGSLRKMEYKHHSLNNVIFMYLEYRFMNIKWQSGRGMKETEIYIFKKKKKRK